MCVNTLCADHMEYAITNKKGNTALTTSTKTCMTESLVSRDPSESQGGSPLTGLSCVSEKNIKSNWRMMSWTELGEDQIIPLQLHTETVSDESAEGTREAKIYRRITWWRYFKRIISSTEKYRKGFIEPIGNWSLKYEDKKEWPNITIALCNVIQKHY